MPKAEIPEHYCCSITQDIMLDPVMLIETGHSYERSAITAWLQTHNTSPLDGRVLVNKTIVPNISLKQIIEDWLEQYPQCDDDEFIAAFKQGNINDIKRLIKLGANIKTTDEIGLTALHHAVKGNNEELVDYLLSLSVDVNAQSHANSTPLHFATLLGLTPNVKRLLARGANVNLKSTRLGLPLHCIASSKQDNAEFVDRLIEAGADVNALNDNGTTALHIATNRGHINKVRALLQAKANVNCITKDGFTPLHIAVDNNQEAIVNLLLEAGANVNAQIEQGITALYRATQKNNDKLVKLLLDAEADATLTDESGDTPLHIAVTRDDNINVVSLLLGYSHPWIITVQNKGGVTPLHRAVIYDQVANVKEFIQIQQTTEFFDNINYLDINLVDNEGYAPLHYAAQLGLDAIVRLLLDAGATIEAELENKAIYGMKPLHAAVANGHESIVRILLEKGADVNAVSMKGITPLHCAAIDNRQSIAKLLLDNGANKKAKTSDNKTPSEVAREYQHFGLASYIENYSQKRQLLTIIQQQQQQMSQLQQQVIQLSIFNHSNSNNPRLSRQQPENSSGFNQSHARKN